MIIELPDGSQFTYNPIKDTSCIYLSRSGRKYVKNVDYDEYQEKTQEYIILQMAKYIEQLISGE